MDDQTAFILSIKDAVIAYAHEYDLPASICIAQACRESGFGASELACEANNLFGRKKGSKWEGEIYYKRSPEYYPEVSTDAARQAGYEPILERGPGWYWVQSPFRKYIDWDDSIEDYFKVLRTYKVYAPITALLPDYKAYLYALAAKYASDNRYAVGLEALIREYNLQQYEFNNYTNTDL